MEQLIGEMDISVVGEPDSLFTTDPIKDVRIKTCYPLADQSGLLYLSRVSCVA